MPRFGTKSTQRLQDCHFDLQRLFQRVVAEYDCVILTGHRGEEAQNKAFDGGKSKLRFPDGKHNALPSNAMDVAPYPIDWNDMGRFKHFAGYVQGVAYMMGLNIRWGGDWDQDFDMTDQDFNDLVHFELRNTE